MFFEALRWWDAHTPFAGGRDYFPTLYDVSALAFYPTDKHYLIGGLSSGQIIVWRLSPSDLGSAAGSIPLSSANR